jgi:hypothetical protein
MYSELTKQNNKHKEPTEKTNMQRNNQQYKSITLTRHAVYCVNVRFEFCKAIVIKINRVFTE